MTWFSNSVAERALTLITQHMHECELRAEQSISRTAGLEAKLDSQDVAQKTMHEANLARFAKLDQDANARFIKLMFMVITTLLSALAAFVFEIVTHR